MSPKDLAGATAYVLVRTGTQPAPAVPDDTPSKPSGWLAKTAQNTSYGYVSVYSQPDNAWVALNFVAVASWLAWMLTVNFPIRGRIKNRGF